MVSIEVTIYASDKYEGSEKEFIQTIREAITAHPKHKGYTSLGFVEMANPIFVVLISVKQIHLHRKVKM